MIALEGSFILLEQFRPVIDGFAAPAPVFLACQEGNEAGISFL